jgi:hypothetical protein
LAAAEGIELYVKWDPIERGIRFLDEIEEGLSGLEENREGLPRTSIDMF